MGSAALGASLGYFVAEADSAGSNMLLGALMFLSSGSGVLAALVPKHLMHAFKERGTALEKARGAPMGGIVWSWLVYGLAHPVLGGSRLWWAALGLNSAIGLLGVWRLHQEVIVDE